MNESLTYKTEKRIYDFLPHEPESITATLFILGMSIYYLWRMFAITPLYDELYTYYTFISRGPFYAAIHWPLPNNHVGYSVLSAILDLMGNSYIGLRGVSYICAVSNIILVNRICKRYFSHGLPLVTMIIFGSMQVVNEYAVQGRGYTLATTCFLLSIYAACNICNADDTGKFYYRALALSFILGLYTIPSSIYWVIPMSCAIGGYLLINAYASRSVRGKVADSLYFKKFNTFFIYGLIAAFITFILYGVIWLAIGSNLLVKTEGTGFTGLSHGTVLLRAPIAALLRGMNYMLDQPYIQSLPVEEFNDRAFGWLLSLFNYMLPGMMYIVLFVVVAGGIIAIYECIKHLAYSRTLINLIIISNLFITGFMLVFQHKLPYLRVFSYSGFVVALCFSTCLERLINVTIRFYNRKQRGVKKDGEPVKEVINEVETTVNTDKWYSGIGVYIPVLAAIILFCFRALSYEFNAQLGTRENDVFNTLYIADVGRRHNIAVTDCDQQYLLKFGWDIDCEKTDVDGADCVILDKNLMAPGYNGSDFWKFYQSYETINWDYIKSMRAIYENENFVLYIK